MRGRQSVARDARPKVSLLCLNGQHETCPGHIADHVTNPLHRCCGCPDPSHAAEPESSLDAVSRILGVAAVRPLEVPVDMLERVDRREPVTIAGVEYVARPTLEDVVQLTSGGSPRRTCGST